MIVRNGMDVTEEIFAKAKTLAQMERKLTNNFAGAVEALMVARDRLDRLPRPWMNDCIADSIGAIDKIIEGLRGA